MNQKTSERSVQMDLLRIAACIMVIVMHVVADGIYVIDVRSVQWTVLTVYSNLCRGAVPAFFMLSGMFSRGKDWKRALKKAGMYLLIYAAWTVLYHVAGVYGPHFLNGAEISVTWASFLDGLRTPKYHLWFIPAFAGVTLLAPAVNALAEYRSRLIDDLAVLFAAGTLGVRTLELIFDRCPEVLKWLDVLPDFSMGYIGMYIVGRWMCEHRAWLQKRQWMVYLLGLLSMIAVFTGTRSASFAAGQMSDLFYDHFDLFITLEAMAWITLFWQFRIPSRLHGAVSWLAGNTLFIYLIHVLVIDAITWRGIYAYKLHWLLGVPIKTAAVFAICCILCAIREGLKKAWHMCAGKR